MRQLKSLSYSSLSSFERDAETFYLERLADVRLTREKQGPPAAIGSAFDARVKNRLAADLQIVDDSLEFELLFELQVEQQNRDLAREDSKLAFDAYVNSGAYASLLAELSRSETTPQFESEVSGVIDGVPLLGKPDCRYTLNGTVVILDWKVRSFYSKSGASPTQGFRLCRDGFTDKPTRSHGTTHKKYQPTVVCGMTIHSGSLHEFSGAYADQLSIYSWVLGEPIGSDFIAAIDELVCSPGPRIRVAELRSRVSEEHQRSLLERIKICWETLTSGHIFRDLTPEKSLEKQRMLDETAKNLCGTDEDDVYMAKQGRKGWF